MVKFVLIVGAIVVAALVVVLLIASTRPDTFQVERSTDIKAPPDKIFALINDFQKWRSWSPYEALDPQMKRSYSANPVGKGAVYTWNGNGKAGEGRMEITDAAPGSHVTLKLDFIRPFEGHNMAGFKLRPNASGTKVTWVMDGPSPLIAKVMGLFVDMDHMIGKDFETGLANIKAIAER